MVIFAFYFFLGGVVEFVFRAVEVFLLTLFVKNDFYLEYLDVKSLRFPSGTSFTFFFTVLI